MFQDELQKRIHEGDRESFRELYNRYSRDVYSLTQTALGNEDSARVALKQVFMKLYREILNSDKDLDLAERLSALTNEEIRLARILAGELSRDALQVQYTVSIDRDMQSDDTMMRIRSRMMQRDEADSIAPVPVREERPSESIEMDSLFAENREEYPAEPDRNEQRYRDADSESRPRKKPHSEENREYREYREDRDDLDLGSPEKKKGASVFVLILLIVFVLVFLWLLLGILMDLGMIPFADLGYRLFNQNVFNFFKIPS